MTNQELFDFVFAKIVEQGRPSMNHSNKQWFCAYRGEGGTKCAAGWLIPDESYDSTWEGTRATRMPLKIVLWTADQLDLVGKMQDAHDLAASQSILKHRDFVQEFKDNMSKIVVSQ